MIYKCSGRYKNGEEGVMTAGFSGRQFIITVLMGVTLWFVAAIMLRYLEPMGVLNGQARILTYAMIIPGTLPFVFLIKLVAGLGRHQLALGLSLATGTALLCDGVATAWFPALYGPTDDSVLRSASTILWGGGVAIWLGFLCNREAD